MPSTVSTYIFGAVTKMSPNLNIRVGKVNDICMHNDLKIRPLCVVAHVGKGLPNGRSTEQLIIFYILNVS